jgi:Cys-rich protein (TIGR01571 family)
MQTRYHCSNRPWCCLPVLFMKLCLWNQQCPLLRCWRRRLSLLVGKWSLSWTMKRNTCIHISHNPHVAGFVFWVKLDKKSCLITVVSPVNTLSCSPKVLFSCCLCCRSFTDSFIHSSQPQGGVKEGQVFRVPFQNEDSEETKQWKDGIFACFGYGIFHPMLWNAWCCPQLLLSQVLTRLDMTWLAERAERSSPTFRRITFLFVAICVLDTLRSPPLLEMKLDSQGGVLYSPSQSTMFKELFLFCLSIPMSIYSLIVLVKLRAAVRNKYGIKTGIFGCLEDLCCVCCCHCCMIAQLARQTADYGREAASCCSKNGLRSRYTKVAPSSGDDDICLQIV